MKLKRYALIAEIVGGLAVIVGLIFVGLELRQNTIMQKVTATQTLVVDYENAIDAIGQDTKIACIYVRGINGLENLNGIERYRFFYFVVPHSSRGRTATLLLARRHGRSEDLARV